MSFKKSFEFYNLHIKSAFTDKLCFCRADLLFRRFIVPNISKRDLKYNSILEIEYIDKMVKKVIKLSPNETCYLTVTSLPISIQRLAIKNLITISEVSSEELNKRNQQLNTKNNVVNNDENKKIDERQLHSNKKKSIIKKEDEI